MKIEFKKSVSKDLDKLDPSTAVNVLDDMRKAFSRNDFGKPLKGNYKGLWSLRLGDYRIIYVKNKEIVLILKIAHRKEVYKYIL